MTSLVHSLFGRRPGPAAAGARRTPVPPEGGSEGEPGREAQIAGQIRFLREQELRRARTSVPPPRR